MADHGPHAPAPAELLPPPRRIGPLRVRAVRKPGGFLAQMRVRKKLMFLHTVFSLGLAAILLVLLRPAISEVVLRAEMDEAKLLLRSLGSDPRLLTPSGVDGPIRWGSPSEIGIEAEAASRAAAAPGTPIELPASGGAARAVIFQPLPDRPGARYVVAEVLIAEARAAVTRMYAIVTVALLAGYGLVAAALEIFVLPQHVYGPIRRMLAADLAVQERRADEELIPDRAIPADELGEIMRSRNRSIVSLRRHQADLADALAQLESVATDLKRKNHLLEAARRNLADADRLASLGMMSAGIAHELNTPLTVLKGLVERLEKDPRAGVDPEHAALMGRVVRRLERLGESLLDFARVRPAETRATDLNAIVKEAATLVMLDREARDVRITNRIPEGSVVQCDSDRFVQVLVNILRNAVDAIRRRPPGLFGDDDAEILVDVDRANRDGREWVSLTVTDNGPGIDPEILPRLFEPFVSSRLDSRGTGLGLAVADGIVREHGGLILARNRVGSSGSVFEIVIPGASPMPLEAAASAPPPTTL
jgi:signal transduction histidine kinase